MKITEHSAIKSLTEDNIMMVDGPEGTKIIPVCDAILSALHAISVENHKRFFRGKNLGTAVTAEQKAAISNGTFEDIWLGDYWVINGVVWRVVDFDYWYNTGDTECETHHLVIMPDSYLYEAVMNSSATVVGGYTGSAMYKANLAQAKTVVKNAFGDMVITHREFLTDAVSGDYPTTGKWFDSTVELPNEVMMFGSYIHGSCGPNAKRYTTDKTQLALYNVAPGYLNTRTTYWLRDVANYKSFASVGYHCTAKLDDANTSLGVRPVFAIG